MKVFTDLLKVGIGFERLFFFMLISLVLIHIVSCLWIMIPQLSMEGDNPVFHDSWLEQFQDLHHSSTDVYATSFYWTVTTITTVGYGEINGNTTLERLFCSIVMIIGVISFSFVNGSLASILSNYDTQHASIQERVAILNKLYKEY